MLDQLHQIDLRAAKYFSEGSYAAMIGFEVDFTDMELRYVGAGITQFYFNGKIIQTPGMLVGIIQGAEFNTGKIPINEGDCIYFLTDGFTDRLSQVEYASTVGNDFEYSVALLEELAINGKLRDDATGLCFRINGGKR